MAEKWKKVSSVDNQMKAIEVTAEEQVYNVVGEVVVRSVQLKGLTAERKELMSRIDRIDLDLFMIDQIQSAELAEKGKK